MSYQRSNSGPPFEAASAVWSQFAKTDAALNAVGSPLACAADIRSGSKRPASNSFVLSFPAITSSALNHGFESKKVALFCARSFISMGEIHEGNDSGKIAGGND